MQPKFQRFGLVLVVIATMAYVCYRAWMAGGLENLMNEFRGISPTPAVSESPLASPTKTPTRTSVPSSSAAPQPAPTGTAGAILFRINERRAGSVVLQSNAILMREAQEHASDMARRGYFDHNDPEGITFRQRMAASGYPAVAVAENLGLTSDDASAIVGLWMDSPSHRSNMLNPDFRAVGIGIAKGTWEGQQVTFVVAIFGAER